MSLASVPQSSPQPSRTGPLHNRSFRELIEERRRTAQTLTLGEAIGIMVPLCLHLKAHHGTGKKLLAHPSAVVGAADGSPVVDLALAIAPSHARDRACIAPELQASLEPGDARASVFAVGAMLYEAITGAPIGPGMRRPREVNPDWPSALESLLSKALVADPEHRPDDLGALASALHNLAPAESLRPPSANEDALTGEFEVEVRLSILPPEEVNPSVAKAPVVDALGDPFGNVIERTSHTREASSPNATTMLAALKQRLESDPRPRYVVVKNRMDHGPFSAVELLQQIASHTFVAEDVLRDDLTGQSHSIAEWQEFAPFAEQAARHREIQAEKIEVAKVEKAEKKAGAAKSVVGLLAVGAAVGLAVLGFVIVREARDRDVKISDDPAGMDLSIDGGLKGGKRAARGGGGGGGGGGGAGFAPGMSYEAALNANNEEIRMGAGGSGPDLSDGQLSAPMRNAAFITGCGAPDSMKVTVKVAVKMGRAVGVSVYTNPSNPGVASCVDRHVRGLSWPAHPKMDTFTTTY